MEPKERELNLESRSMKMFQFLKGDITRLKQVVMNLVSNGLSLLMRATFPSGWNWLKKMRRMPA